MRGTPYPKAGFTASLAERIPRRAVRGASAASGTLLRKRGLVRSASCVLLLKFRILKKST